MDREFNKSLFWLCPAGRRWIKSDKMARIGAKHERQRTRSDNVWHNRAAAVDAPLENALSAAPRSCLCYAFDDFGERD
ncbi:hypothetical protein Mal65_02100 [Crateriforma conspicua]|nr:hypothetical protein Mal65_02100 [Crateriforma conspicua]